MHESISTTYTDDTDYSGTDYYHYNYSFIYKGIEFDQLGEDEFHSEIRLTVKTGLFGWEYIEEIRFK